MAQLATREPEAIGARLAASNASPSIANAECERLRVIIEQSVAQVFGIALRDLEGPTRGRAHVALARQIAMYTCHVSCGRSLTDVGRIFGRDRTTVAHACSLVEDRRDDALFDHVIELLDRIVRSLIEPRSAFVHHIV
ncbi:MAG: helix-turn-helix domain-containing protein [Hyphomicrobium sp.]|nr:helix-turn-helix domain-containing protein [Hyphomicrobium sp.]